jgi:hypothetical protein
MDEKFFASRNIWKLQIVIAVKKQANSNANVLFKKNMGPEI